MSRFLKFSIFVLVLSLYINKNCLILKKIAGGGKGLGFDNDIGNQYSQHSFKDSKKVNPFMSSLDKRREYFWKNGYSSVFMSSKEIMDKTEFDAFDIFWDNRVHNQSPER